MQTLKELRERIKLLETERANLLLEIEKLKKAALERINSLEAEISTLREEAKSFQEFLGCASEKANNQSEKAADKLQS